MKIVLGITVFSLFLLSTPLTAKDAFSQETEDPCDQPETGTLELATGSLDLPISDTGYLHGAVLEATSAPGGAEITNIRYRLLIDDDGDGAFACSDYTVWLHSGITPFERRVWNRHGGVTDGGWDDDGANDRDIYLERATGGLGLDPNQDWWVLVEDAQPGNAGVLRYFEIEIDWKVPKPTPTPPLLCAIEPDDTKDQAFLSEFPSPPRAIAPIGDEDWHLFQLDHPSEVVIETEGPSGDTWMGLYTYVHDEDSNLVFQRIDSDDDGGTGSFSRISRTGSLALSAGQDYWIQVEEDGGNQVIPEYRVTLRAYPTDLPDLVITGLRTSTDFLFEGDPFWIEADLENRSAVAAGASHAELSFSPDLDWETGVPALAPRESKTLRWEMPFPDVEGSVHYETYPSVATDSRDEVMEAEEGILWSAATVEVWEPLDLTALDVYFRDQPFGGGGRVDDPQPGQLLFPYLDYDVDVQNGALSGWWIDLDGIPLCVGTTVHSGTATATCSSPWGVVAGTHQLRATVDFADELYEVDESNNVALQPFTVPGIPAVRVEPADLVFTEGSKAGVEFRAVTPTDPAAPPIRTAATGGTPPRLLLRGGAVDLLERQDARTSLAALLAATPEGETRHALLQFERPLAAHERRRLAEDGVRILHYVPQNAYWAAVAGNEAAASDLGLRSGNRLHRAWSPTPAVKTSPQAQAGRFPPNATFADGSVLLHVTVFPDVAPGAAIEAIQQVLGASVRRRVLSGLWEVRAGVDRVEEIAALDPVEWVEPAPPPNAPANAVAADRVRVDVLQAPPWNLSGSGVGVGIWDAGAVDEHADFGTRLTVHDEAAPVRDHSTHVAGTVGGSGAGEPEARGMAPGVQLHSWDWTDDGNEVVMAFANGLLHLSNHSYGPIAGWELHRDTGEWLHWGDAVFGLYSGEAAAWDEHVVGSTGATTFRAAGNDRGQGPDGPGGPRVDGPYDSIAGVATAKNVITVCATDDEDAMSGFSGWGPTDDGRIKPDLCANGTSLLSTLPGDGYGTLSGTSMATPGATGVAALLSDLAGGYLDAPLLKGLLIQGAEDLRNPGPDYESGWGLIDAEASARLVEDESWLRGSLATTGQGLTYLMDVPPGASELKMTLTWHDGRTFPGAVRAIVNDLDLTLTAPDGTVHRAWVLDPSNPSAPASRGTNVRDNVEQVGVTAPAAGRWQAHVRGGEVGFGPQTYYLVGETVKALAPGASFYVFNDGNAPLTVDEIELGEPASWIAWAPDAPFTVPPGQWRAVDVTVDFASAPEGTSTRNLWVRTNDSTRVVGITAHNLEGPPPCGSVDLTAQIVSGTETFEACDVLSAGDGFTVSSAGDVTFRAGGAIVLRDGFAVESGASFEAVIEP